VTDERDRARDGDERARDEAAAEVEPAPPPTVPIDPHGDDPEHIPDPMPADLQRTSKADHAFEAAEPMEGEAPTG
jgi:hypothetical protein